MTIQIRVTKERYEDIVSIDDDIHFFEMTNKDAYDYLVQFVVNEKGEYISVEDARKLFKKVPRKELNAYVKTFIESITNAFVNPTSGAGLDEPS